MKIGAYLIVLFSIGSCLAKSAHADFLQYSFQDGTISLLPLAPSDPLNIVDERSISVDFLIDDMAQDIVNLQHQAFFVPDSLIVTIDGIEAETIDVGTARFQDNINTGSAPGIHDQIAISFAEIEWGGGSFAVFGLIGRFDTGTFDFNASLESPPNFGQAVLLENSRVGLNSRYTVAFDEGTVVTVSSIPEPHSSMFCCLSLIVFSVFRRTRLKQYHTE